MDEVFDQAAAPPPDDVVDRVADWLVGDRLASVLHLGDTPLAYQLSRRGHEVVVADPEARSVRDSELLYVRSGRTRLPFAGGSFDAVVAADLDVRPTALAEYARVLRPGGHLATLSRVHDESLPWLRRLTEIVGRREQPPLPDARSLMAAGLFAEPEVRDDVRWEQLDLARLLRLAHQRGTHGVGDASSESAVRALFAESTAHTGHLRLRHVTHAVRARVVKDVEQPQRPGDTVLFELR